VSTTSAPIIYRIDELEVDAARGCLRRAGQDVHLKPKAFQLLIYLLAQRERLVTKEELIAFLWKDTAVSDDSLAQCVAELRRALGDSPRNPLYLKTYPRRGYRFVGEVEEVRQTDLVASEQITTVQIREEYHDEPPRRPNRLAWILAALLVVSTATAAWLWWGRNGPPAARSGKRQIAVLRFENRSGQAELDWLRDGLPDMLTTTLSRSNGLDVLSREQVSLWLGRVGDNGLAAALEIARRSHAQAAVLGSFQKAGESIRIDARAYDGSGALVAAESITVSKVESILTQVDFLSARLAQRLASRDATKDRRLLSSLMTDNLEAYRYYVLGLAKAEAIHIDEAVQLFQKAVQLDPNFAMAYARIGYAYAVPGSRPDVGRPYLEKAFRMSAKLTEKDRRQIVAWYAIANRDYQEAIRGYSALVAAYPNETEPYYRLALVLRGESRHEEGVDALRQALAIDPEDAKLANSMATLLSEMGRHDEAIEMAQRYIAMATADVNAYDSLGLAYQFAGEYDKSLAAFAKGLESSPDFEITRLHRAITWMEMGREREALAECLARAEAATSNQARYWQMAAWLYWRRGKTAEAMRALAKYHQFEPNRSSWIPVDGSAIPVDSGQTAWARRWRAYYLAERARMENRPDARMEHLREAMRYKPSWATPETLEDALADRYFEAGRLDDAIAEYERALKLYPGMARARLHLAQAYRRAGHDRASKEQFRQFLDLWKHADADLPEIAEARAAVGR
jgi:DNA-binding winged helix-turn-helix (wHTH) protein/predicted Zn-dependent protease/TolB-like protein